VVDEGTMPNTDAIFTLAVLAEHEEASMWTEEPKEEVHPLPAAADALGSMWVPHPKQHAGSVWCSALCNKAPDERVLGILVWRFKGPLLLISHCIHLFCGEWKGRYTIKLWSQNHSTHFKMHFGCIANAQPWWLSSLVASVSPCA
jgi:hypothetical protein